MVKANSQENKFARIVLVLTDCDGVLTDAGVYYGAEGELLKRFNIRDGMGVERLRQVGIETGIVSGERSLSLKCRAEKLKIEEVHLGARDKLSVLQEITERRQIPATSIAYIGDDVNDIEIIQAVGLSACPKDAIPEVRELVDFVCEFDGGHGAFRSFAEKILRSR